MWRGPVDEVAGAAWRTVLPFPRLNQPGGVAVGSNGTVYVVDEGNKRIVAVQQH